MKELEAGARVRVIRNTGAVLAGTEADVVGVYPQNGPVDCAIEVRRGVILRVPVSSLQPVGVSRGHELRVA